MCGILGGSKQEWDYESGIASMAHRGPDGSWIEVDQNFVMAFARLSIMDLSVRAMQPMFSKDRQVCLCFNGEIYGFQSLKKILERKYIFQTTSDTEVILNAYLEYGDSFTEKIDGMFAIAIFDKRHRQIKLFRDRAGIKPLYYFYNGFDFAFASELKGLEHACNTVRWELDQTALYDYLVHQYIPDPKSIYKNVYKLPPASKLVYDLTSHRILGIERYWRLKVNETFERKRDPLVIEEHLRYLLRKSVKEQMIADVPVGTYLSGGIDSSIITFEASRLKQDIRTFTMGFKEKPYDESSYAELLIRKYGIQAKTKILDRSQVKACRGRMKEWYDEPFSDTSAYPTYLVSKMAKDEVTAVLTGDGGDELFGGYERYRMFLQKKSMIRSRGGEAAMRFMVAAGLLSEEEFQVKYQSKFHYYATLMGKPKDQYLREAAKRLGISRDYDPYWLLRRHYNKDLPPLTRVKYLDFKTYLPGDILTKVDRTSMAVSLEARVPFLSREIIEFAFSLSQEECCPAGVLKGVVKNAYKDRIPDEILYRKKRGFSLPPDYLRAGGSPQILYERILKKEWPGLWQTYFSGANGK